MSSPSSKRKTPALCFFWFNPVVLQDLTKFFNYFSAEHNLEFFIITNNFPSKLQFLKAGVQAFTVEELIKGTPPGHECAIADSQLESMLRYDLVTGLLASVAGNISDIPSYARQVLNAYSWLTEKLSPKLAFTWNGCAFLQNSLAYVANQQKISCFFMERGLLVDSLVIDPLGVNFGSALAGENWKGIKGTEPTDAESKRLSHYRECVLNSKRTVVTHGVDCDPQQARDSLKIPSGATVVMLPLQIETDSNILFYSPFYKSMCVLIQELQEALKFFGNTFLVIKPHPEDQHRLAELEAWCGPQCRVSTNLSLPSLLSMVDVVTVINSTVGLEALIYGKPVVVLGQAIYGQKGFTFDLQNPQDLGNQLAKAMTSAPRDSFQSGQFQRFLIYLLQHHLFRTAGDDEWGSRQIISQQVIESIPKNDRIMVPNKDPSFAELTRQNQTIVELLSNPASHSLFFLSSKSSTDFFRENLPPNCQLVDFPNEIGILELSCRLFRSFDYALSDKRAYIGWKGVIGKILWQCLRARKKILY